MCVCVCAMFMLHLSFASIQTADNSCNLQAIHLHEFYNFRVNLMQDPIVTMVGFLFLFFIFLNEGPRLLISFKKEKGRES